MSDDLKDRIELKGGGDSESRLFLRVLAKSPDLPLIKVALQGRVDVFNYLQLSEALQEAAAGREAIAVLLDLTEVTFIASSGWSVLLSVRSHLKRSQSRLVLVGMNPHVDRTYRAMRLPDLIPAYGDLAAAEAATQS